MKTKQLMLLVAAIFGLGYAKAQKPVDVQQISIAAPKLLRVDGNLTEWTHPLAAENKRTEVSYTLANDDKAVYLALKATSANAITKIMSGGISFSINNKGKKRDEESFEITYPFTVRNANRAGQGQNRQRNQNSLDRTQQQRDSASLVQRKTVLAGVKEIKVKGFTAITDSLISIYNEFGIKAKAIIDEQGAYCFELAVPFKQLEISPASTKEFAYQIRLNGRPLGQNAMARTGGGNRSNNFGAQSNMARQDLNNPTDFWGKYPLSLK